MNMKFRRYFIFILLSAAVLAWTAGFYSLPDDRLKVYALDVGQGDAIFIETPRKAQVLIDGGPDMKVLGQLSAVMPFYDRSIDLLILTHPQEDHMFGLVEVLKRYKVGKVLITGVNYKSKTYEEFKRIIKGLYYHKLKKPLPPCASLKVYFKDIHDFNKIDFDPQWKEVEKDIFRYFLYTQQGDDVKGISGLVFYEKIFCLGFFGL